MKNKRRQKTIQLAVWTWIWVASLALASIGSRFLWENSDLFNLLSITINIVLGVMMIIANRNMFNTYDELERKIQPENLTYLVELTTAELGDYDTIRSDLLNERKFLTKYFKEKLEDYESKFGSMPEKK